MNDAKMKYLFDNRYGTGQSAFDGWMNATNLIVAGKTMWSLDTDGVERGSR